MRQQGARRLWDEAEATHRWWRDAGDPQAADWHFTVTPDTQRVELVTGGVASADFQLGGGSFAARVVMGASARMDVTVSVVGPDAAVVEELRSLVDWLTKEEELRGRVRLVEAPPEPGTLGWWPQAVEVALNDGGAVTILASAVITWIRYRTSEMTLTITRPDGTSVKLKAKRIRNAGPAEVGELVERTVAALGEGHTEGIREGIH